MLLCLIVFQGFSAQNHSAFLSPGECACSPGYYAACSHLCPPVTAVFVLKGLWMRFKSRPSPTTRGLAVLQREWRCRPLIYGECSLNPALCFIKAAFSHIIPPQSQLRRAPPPRSQNPFDKQHSVIRKRGLCLVPSARQPAS